MPSAPVNSLASFLLTPVIRTKARQGQSDGESGEVCCEFASFSGTLLMVETRRYKPELSRIWPDRVAVFFCALAPRVLLRRPTEQPFGKSFSDKSGSRNVFRPPEAPSHQKSRFWSSVCI